MAKKKIFTKKELQQLSAKQVIDKLQHENYSLLATLGAENLRKEMVPVGKACNTAINYLISEKEHIIKKDGLLEYYHTEENMDNVGGLVNLKKWLKILVVIS